MRINQISSEQKEKEAAFLTKIMDEEGVGPTALGDRIGANQAMVSKWRSAIKPIPTEWLFKLAGELKFDPFELRPSLAVLKLEDVGALESDSELAKKMEQFLTLASPEEVKKLEAYFDISLSVIMNKTSRPK